MPTAFHLFQSIEDKTKHTLEVDFMHAYDKSLSEDYTVRVILPEGARNIHVELPGNLQGTLESIEMTKYFGTLDYFGRPTIVMKKTNAVHEMCEGNIKVTYNFNNSRDLYLEPICMFALVFSVFLSIMVYSRLGFDLEAKSAKVKETKTE